MVKMVNGLVENWLSFERNGDIMRFDSVVSIGFFCSVARELQKLGYRDSSYPFDWVICDLRSVSNLIENNFKDLFNPKYLFFDEQKKSIVRHRKYWFSFYHDFNSELSLESQIEAVSLKYIRRIKRFYNLIGSKKSILFIRYMMGSIVPASQDEEIRNIDEFINIIRSYTNNFKVILIKHENLILENLKRNDHILSIFNVEPSPGDSVNRNFIYSTTELYEFFNSEIEYDEMRRINNLSFSANLINRSKS